MRIEPQVRLAVWLHDRSPTGDAARMSTAAIARGRLPHGGDPAARWAAGRPEPGVSITDGVVRGAVGNTLPVRFYRPGSSGPRAGTSAALPLVVRYHGGGWVLGNPRSADWLCSGVAAGAGALVASVGYRLAPEHRAPAAALDAAATVRDLVARAGELGADPDRVAVMGESAGGNLAAVAAQLLRDGGPPLAGQVLSYPGTDGTLSGASMTRLAGAPGLSRRDVEAFLAAYTGPDGDPADPVISPLLAPDLRGLPPALIQTAEHDPLLDDGARYATALRAAGVAARYTCYLGIPHGWVSMPRLTRVAAQARAEAVDFLTEVFSPGISAPG